MEFAREILQYSLTNQRNDVKSRAELNRDFDSRDFSLLAPAPCRVQSWARFSKAPETFRARKAIAKSRTLRVQRCFSHIF